MAVYHASKAYVLALSRDALHRELTPGGVRGARSAGRSRPSSSTAPVSRADCPACLNRSVERVARPGL